jgi:leucyl aminopeptidase
MGVGQGSNNPPRLVKMTYAPPGARGKVALVGKGVVFDSGGLSLKTGSGMETMKTDMGGGAAVFAAMSTLRDLGVKTRVLGYVPLVENMPSGTAIRPGDVLRIRNGKTVEVLNTDAEGRLILADALSLASEDKPAAVIDLATLTGACVVALGEKIAGLMGNDDDWSSQVQAAADRVGERVWPLPLPTDYPEGSTVVAVHQNAESRRRCAHRGCSSGVRRRRSWVHSICWTRALGKRRLPPKGGTGRRPHPDRVGEHLPSRRRPPPPVRKRRLGRRRRPAQSSARAAGQDRVEHGRR